MVALCASCMQNGYLWSIQISIEIVMLTVTFNFNGKLLMCFEFMCAGLNSGLMVAQALCVTQRWGCLVLGVLSCVLPVLVWKSNPPLFQVTCPSSCVPGLTSSLIPDCFHLFPMYLSPRLPLSCAKVFRLSFTKALRHSLVLLSIRLV